MKAPILGLLYQRLPASIIRSLGALLLDSDRFQGYCRHKPTGACIIRIGEFPKIRGTLFGGPYNRDPTN